MRFSSPGAYIETPKQSSTYSRISVSLRSPTRRSLTRLACLSLPEPSSSLRTAAPMPPRRRRRKFMSVGSPPPRPAEVVATNM